MVAPPTVAPLGALIGFSCLTVVDLHVEVESIVPGNCLAHGQSFTIELLVRSAKYIHH